jgi:hypothetical protein
MMIGCQRVSLQQLFGRLDEEGEIDRSPMAKMRPPKSPRSRYRCCPVRTCGTYWRTVQARTSTVAGPGDHPAVP